MKYELGPIPWSLASVDGTISKTMKSSLLQVLNDKVNPLTHLPKECIGGDLLLPNCVSLNAMSSCGHFLSAVQTRPVSDPH